jgi:hypothetical protein
MGVAIYVFGHDERKFYLHSEGHDKQIRYDEKNYTEFLFASAGSLGLYT